MRSTSAVSEPAEYEVDENVSVEESKLKIVGQVVSGILMTFLTPLSHNIVSFKHLDEIDTQLYPRVHPQKWLSNFITFFFFGVVKFKVRS